MQRSFYAVIVAAILFMWMARKMIASTRKIEAGTPGEHIFDMRIFGYSPEEARAYLGKLGDEGRSRYKWQLRFEWLFIIVYGIFGASIGISLAAFLYNQSWTLLCWLPGLGGLLIVAAALIDLDESQHIAKMLKIWPKFEETHALRAARSTRLKWLCVFVGVALILVGIALAAIAKLKGW